MEVDNLASRQLLSGFCRKCFFSVNQQDCQGEGTDDFTRSSHPQDNIWVDNFPQTRPGEMDWAARGNCHAHRWLDLRCKAVRHEGLQASARLTSPPSCQPRPRKCHGRKPWSRSKKTICLALESRILFLDGDFLRVWLLKTSWPHIVCGVPCTVALVGDLKCLAYSQLPSSPGDPSRQL